jgi:PTH1 family peptidyl-tRNA hydrolase
MVKQHQIELNNILVVYDDINIPLGQIRVRGQGSAGGHNGLESIIQTLNSRDIARARCGIKEEKPVKNRVNYVLSPFSKKDIPLVEEMIEMAKKVVYTFIRHGLAKTMNSYNKKIIAPQN